MNVQVKKIVMWGVIAVLVGAGGAYFIVKRSGASAQETLQNAAAGGSLQKSKEAIQGNASKGRSTAVYSSSNVVKSMRSSESLFSSDSRLIALSADELQWMERHHYPSQQELEALDAIGLDVPMGRSDPKLETLRGLALLKNGREIGAITTLTEAGAQGAIYAYQQAALAEYALSERRFGKSAQVDTVLRARLEVAKILGDYRAEELIRTYLPEFDERAYAYGVQLQTAEFMRQIGESTQLRGLDPIGPDPRPNEKAWADLRKLNAAGESVQVETYTVGK